jgi:sugar phosphate isomerase/epimerase
MIRIAVAVADTGALPSAFVVWRGIEASIRKAAAFGYDGIELALKTADEVDADRVEALLQETGLGMPVVSTGQVFAGLGLHFTTRDAAERARVVQVFRGMVDLAARFGAMVNIGRVRGFVAEGEPVADAEARFVAVAREVAAYAAECGVTLVLEPVNRYEINFINNVEQGVALLEKVGAPNMALMPDLFHMNIEDAQVAGTLERHADRIAYIHFADSNRLAPGQGHTDFRAVFSALKRVEYDGWVGVEILPEPDADTAARLAVDYLRPLLEDYNRD